jgi:hypothetical protein
MVYSKGALRKTDVGKKYDKLQKKLLFQESLDTVTDEDSYDKDDHKHDDHDKYAKYSEESDTGADVSGSQNYRYNYKDNPEDDPRYRAIPEDALVVVLPFMKKAKCDTNNEIQ